MTTPSTPQAPGSAAGTTPSQPTTPPVEQTEPPKEQPRFVTEDQLADAVEKGFRRAQQSAADRTRNIENQVAQLKGQLSTLGVQVTPEMESKLKEQAIAVVDKMPQQPAAAPTSAQVPGDEPSEGNEVFDWTMALYKEEGITIDKADPEWKEIKAALDNPNGTFVKYQKTVMKAIDTKRARVDAEKDTADARVVGSGETSNALGSDVNPHDLFQEAHRK